MELKEVMLDGYKIGIRGLDIDMHNPYQPTGNRDEYWFWREGWALGDKHRIELRHLIVSIEKLR